MDGNGHDSRWNLAENILIYINVKVYTDSPWWEIFFAAINATFILFYDIKLLAQHQLKKCLKRQFQL